MELEVNGRKKEVFATQKTLLLSKAVAIHHSSRSTLYAVIFYSELVQQDGHLTNVEENVMLRGVSYIARKMFSNHAVPVGRILFVKEFLDALGNELLITVKLINGQVDLLLHVLLHVVGHLANDPCYITLRHFLFI